MEYYYASLKKKKILSHATYNMDKPQGQYAR